MTRVELIVNGIERSAEIPDRKLLVDAVREDFGLTGTKVGCSHGSCGTCTLHVDGVPVRSCLVFAVQVSGQEIRTVEGLAEDGTLSPLQAAFRRFHGLQCGFCTPGFLMTATALLDSDVEIDAETARKHLTGNLCRCTGYEGIVDAVVATAESRDTNSSDEVRP
ncbi:(2Fe-2S)-binding protein [Nocardia sp. X0981]